MGIDFKAKLTAENFNNAFMCRNEDTDTIGTVKAKGFCTEKTTVTATATMDLATDTGTIEITGTGPVDITSFTSTIANGQQVFIINNTDGDITFSVFTKTVTLPLGCSLFLVGCNGNLVPGGAGGGASTSTSLWDPGTNDPNDVVYTGTGHVGIGTATPSKTLHVQPSEPDIDPVQIDGLQDDAGVEHVVGLDLTGCLKRTPITALQSASEVWFIREQTAPNTNAPAAGAVTWNVRQMSNIDLIQPWATIVSPGEFTLQAGTYCVEGSAPAFTVLRHQVRLWDVTNSTTEIIGTSEYAKNGTSTEGHNRSFLLGSFEITAATTYRFEHYTQLASVFGGQGLATNNGIDNIYAQLKITRISS